MRSELLSMTIVALAFSAPADRALAQTQCGGPKGGTVEENLNWCSTNSSGFNEGAVCGLKALAGTVGGLPVDLSQVVLGNTWSRTNMMGATRSAFALGHRDAAVNAAICCQIHNPEAHACLKNNRNAVTSWLSGQVPTGAGRVTFRSIEAVAGEPVTNPIGTYTICGGYTMTSFDGVVSWGDGSRGGITAGRFQGEDNAVLRAEHTYQRPGSYPISARVWSTCSDVQKGTWQDESSGSATVIVKKAPPNQN